ncbi:MULTISPECIES: alpha/beta fold hydrolase [unclassified Variovorax]|uniref:alpha/beta fold hydrolase n=1 Tax=unclassified Variovorax TaxID=663243 RepID=UPI001BD527BE|nr:MULTISPECIES: alpha/beta hydrolase [unclassified Variovorax]
MSSKALGEANPSLLAQCPVHPVPANAADLPVHITECGVKGPPVLFVHGGVQGGIGGGPVNWKGQLPLADMGWKLRLIDRPGFGESPSRGPDDMHADAALIAERLGQSSHLIGHSFGGAESLLAAALRPEAVRSLILVEPALQMMLSTDPQSAADPATKGAAEIIMKYLLSGKTPADYAIGFVGSLGSSDGADNVAVAGLKADPDRATAMGCSLLRAHMASATEQRAAADKVAAAGIPVLIISGGYSASQGATGEALARLTGGRHTVLQEAPSHFLQQDCPDAFNRVVDAFLRDAEAKHSQAA